MAVDQKIAQKSFLDALYCEEEEEKWEDIIFQQEESEITSNNGNKNHSLFPLLLLDQDFFWDDEELQSLFIKEKETCFTSETKTRFSLPRRQPEKKPLNGFLFSLGFQKDDNKPWMMQLAAVTCLSLAAKVEETHVEGAKYVFEAKTIQKMELLVLSGLKWRMNPVTPLSFLDHIIRRLGLKSYAHWEFLRSCENLLLSVIPDPRLICYLPSVLATATMLHVIHQVEPCNAIAYENQLLGVLKISKEEVDDCYELISDVISNTDLQENTKNPLKRKNCQNPSSPGRIMDAIFSCDSSNDSWEAKSCISSSPQRPIFKKARVQEQQMRLPSLNRVFVDPIGSPN
ncbi:hypothetical protein DH2020_006626 [Rehmannia glutinosa]|uniref:Cyclin C-terminal domain-containing protein n=1 Tax=Rehmannia glutinosa TaxID=99300 RepID=A0ABR0XJG1_REHGL